jgi:hypothetical protein
LRLGDQAEQRALWNLCCLLEKQLVEPFKADYVEMLGAARSRLRDEDDEISEPSAPPNGGPAAPVDNSNTPGGPLSVS